jgi:hypothetical protein
MFYQICFIHKEGTDFSAKHLSCNYARLFHPLVSAKQADCNAAGRATVFSSLSE